MYIEESGGTPGPTATASSLRESIRGLADDGKDKLLQAFASVAQAPIHINSRLLSYKCYEVEISFKELKTYGYGANDKEAKHKSMDHLVEHLMDEPTYRRFLNQAINVLTIATPGSSAVTKKNKDATMASQRKIKMNVSSEVGPVYFTSQTENSPLRQTSTKHQVATPSNGHINNGAVGHSVAGVSFAKGLEAQQQVNGNNTNSSYYRRPGEDNQEGDFHPHLNLELEAMGCSPLKSDDAMRPNGNATGYRKPQAMAMANATPTNVLNTSVSQKSSNMNRTPIGNRKSAILPTSGNNLNQSISHGNNSSMVLLEAPILVGPSPKLKKDAWENDVTVIMDQSPGGGNVFGGDYKTVIDNLLQVTRDLNARVLFLENENAMMKDIVNGLVHQIAGNMNNKSILNAMQNSSMMFDQPSLILPPAPGPLPNMSHSVKSSNVALKGVNNSDIQYNHEFFDSKENRFPPEKRINVTGSMDLNNSSHYGFGAGGGINVNTSINNGVATPGGTQNGVSETTFGKPNQIAFSQIRKELNQSNNNNVRASTNNSNKKPVPKLRLDLIKREGF